MQYRKLVKFGAFSGALLASLLASASGTVAYNTTLTIVAVNGGADTANPGVSCIAVAAQVSATCPSGYIYIPGNNKHLVSAALAARASNSKVHVYYEDAAPTGHCPGLAFTPCSVVSIMLVPN